MKNKEKEQSLIHVAEEPINQVWVSNTWLNDVQWLTGLFIYKCKLFCICLSILTPARS